MRYSFCGVLGAGCVAFFGCGGGEPIELTEVDTINLTQAVPNECLQFSLSASAFDCIRLKGVTAELNGEALTRVGTGSILGALPGSDACGLPSWRLEGVCPNVVGQVSTLSIFDETHTVNIGIDNLNADRRLTRLSEGPARRNSELEFAWSVSSDDLTTQVVFLVDDQLVEAEVRQEGVRIFAMVPSSVPLGRTRVITHVAFAPSVRCAGLSCNFRDFISSGVEVEVVAE